MDLKLTDWYDSTVMLIETHHQLSYLINRKPLRSYVLNLCFHAKMNTITFLDFNVTQKMYDLKDNH